MKNLVTGSVQFYGEAPKGMKQFARSRVEEWIEDISMGDAAFYNIRLSCLKYPGQASFDWYGCEIEIFVGGQKYFGRDLSSKPRLAIENALRHLSRVVQDTNVQRLPA